MRDAITRAEVIAELIVFRHKRRPSKDESERKAWLWSVLGWMDRTGKKTFTADDAKRNAELVAATGPRG